jgi:hypothetical protein
MFSFDVVLLGLGFDFHIIQWESRYASRQVSPNPILPTGV